MAPPAQGRRRPNIAPRMPAIPSCRFPPGLSLWEQQLAATRASPTTPIAFHRVHPGGSTTGSYSPRRSALQFLRLGLCPKRDEGRGARWVAASRGSTGTRPAEAQHCASNARNTLLPLSTGFTPVGATTGSYPLIPHHPCRFPPGLSRLEQQTAATPRRSALQFLRLGLRPKRDKGRGHAG